MDVELLSALEKKVETLMSAFAVARHENVRLREENRQLLAQRSEFRNRIDTLLKKLEEV